MVQMGMDFLFVEPKDSGLPYRLHIYSSNEILAKLIFDPVLFIDLGYEELAIEICDNPHNYDGTSFADANMVYDWVKRYKDILLRHWNNELSDKEASALLGK